MWTCPKCQTKIDPSLDVCWQCGTDVDGVEDPSFVRADDAPVIVDPTDVNNIEVPTEGPWGHGVVPVEAYTAESRAQAHFLADELCQIGIIAVAESHEPAESLGGYSALPKVWVRAEDYPRARLWLEGYEMIQRERHPADDV
jgi:hypothetical protein